LRPIRVAYDEQIFLLQSRGGISRYFTELIKTYLDHPELGVTPLLIENRTLNLHLAEELGSRGFSSGISRFNSLVKLVVGLALGRSRKLEADLMHLTFYLPGYFGRYRQLPKVVTLHDMIPEKTRLKTQLWNPHFDKRNYLIKAAAVVSVSNTSTKEMKREFGLVRSVSTTYLGVNSNFSPNAPKLGNLPNSYFLYVGARGGYKDAETVIGALARLPRAYREVHLIFVGGGSLTLHEKELIGSTGMSGYVRQVNISDEELPSLYSNSIALVHSSRYEGFGLPLVEAMASGTPIIASDTEINREIAGEVATYFQAGNLQSLIEVMTNAITGQNGDSTKIKAGLIRAKEFSWVECARQTAEVYRTVMQTSRDKN